MPALSAFAQTVFQEGRGWTDELSCLTKTRGRVPAEISASVMELDGNAYMIALVRDVTDRKRAERRAAERTAELESFSYSVSHDLRCPLRAIDGFSRVLLEEYSAQLDDEGQRLLKIIRRSTETMGWMINDLLALSRLGRQDLNPTHIDVAELVETVFNELIVTQPERNIGLTVDTMPPAHGDQGMMRQVFANLLSNAIKFSSTQAAPRIDVGHMVADDRDVYYVRDNGVGFDMQYVDKLFGVFERLHSAGEFEGAGVGLAIVHRIVQRHGGAVWAKGKVNEGATIYVALPRQVEPRW